MLFRSLGLAASHGPMITTPPEHWHARVPFDQSARHPFRGKTYSFDELVEARKAQGFAEQITPAVWRRRHAACHAALAEMADAFRDARIDAAVIVGDDQNEMLTAVNPPWFFVFTGETIIDEPASEVQLAMMPPGVAISEPGRRPDHREVYPCRPDLARELAARLKEGGYEIEQTNAWTHAGAPANAYGMPHAYS